MRMSAMKPNMIIWPFCISCSRDVGSQKLIKMNASLVDCRDQRDRAGRLNNEHGTEKKEER